jgi:outer membrane protein TolC
LACVCAAGSAGAQGEPNASTPATSLETLTFQQAIQRALEKGTNSVVALEEIQRAEARIREARSASLPTLTGTGTYTRLDADRPPQGTVILPRDQLAANLLLTVPLIVPQRWAQWSHASSDAKVARASAEDVRRQTAITTARAYLTVISEKRVVDINERALKTAKAHFDYAHTRLLGGVGNRVDDVRAEQEMVSDQSQVESAYAGVARAREALGVLLGDKGPVDVVDDVSLAEGPALSNAMSEATSRRGDVRASKERLDAAERVKKDSYTDYLPFLVGTFQPFYQNPETPTLPTTGWQAQLILTIPFYDGGLRYGLSEERESLSAEARAQYDGLVRQARSDVRVAFESVKRAEASLLAAVNAARLAKDALDLANVAYRAGATTNIEVIDAERRAHDAETSAAIAEDVARQARVDLLSATGRFP